MRILNINKYYALRGGADREMFNLEEILKALDEALKNPPPPNPNTGRKSQSGTAPLLPKSSELKMVRALQLRVNLRTTNFDLERAADTELTPGRKLQVQEIARKQKQIERVLRKIAEVFGEGRAKR